MWQCITFFQPYIFAILKSISFIMYCFLPSMIWHQYFKEHTSSASPVGIVSPSKGHPTFKAMRFSMVGVKILSTPFQVADSNNNGGVLLLLLYKESTFASIHHVNSGSKAMYLLTKIWLFTLCRNILKGKIITSFSAASLACYVSTEICMGSWLKTSAVSKPPQCRINSVLSILFTITPV